MKTLLLISISSVVLATGAWGATINYDTTGSTLSCNGVAGCVQNTTTSVTIGGLTFTYNTGSGSSVVTPSIINLGNIVSTGTGTNINVTGLLLTINVNSTPPGASGTLPNGAISGSISTSNSGATILFSPNNTTTGFGTLPGVVISGSGGQAFTYQILNPSLGLQAPTVGNPVGQTSIQGAVTDTSTMTTPPTISKSFTPSSIPVGGTSTLMFTIMNPNSSTTLTGIGFSDSLPAGVTGTAATGSACGGTFTATSTSVALTGGMLASGTSCNFSVAVTGSTAGSKPNTTSAVTSNEGGSGNMAMDTLTVSAAPALTKSFADSQLELLFGSTALTFTVTNPAGNPAPLTNISFSDPLPAGLLVSPLGSGPTGTCVGNGTITAAPGSNSVSLSGATLAPGASCTFTVLVNGSQIGVQTNTTSTVTAGPGTLVGSPATAMISVVNTEFLWFFTEGGGAGAH